MTEGIDFNALKGTGAIFKDDKMPSLVLRDGKRVKTWYFVRKNKVGDVERVKLGVYPDVKISAARNAAKIEAANNRGLVNKYNPSLKEIFESWANAKANSKKSLYKDYRYMAGALAGLADMPLRDITRDHVSELKKTMSKTPVAFNRALALLKTLYNYARKSLEIDIYNAAEGITKYPETPRRNKLPIEKSSAFFAELDKPGRDRDSRDIIKILLYTGQRKNNVFAMEWSEIDLSSGIWLIPSSKAKGGRDMPTVLAQEVVDILRRRRAELDKRRSDKWVFPAKRARTHGKPGPGHIRDIRSTFGAVCKAIGQENLTLHDLRRTLGTWMLNAGASIEQVSKQLHHSDIRVTQKVYSELLLDNVRSGVDLMRAAIDKNRKTNINTQ